MPIVFTSLDVRTTAALPQFVNGLGTSEATPRTLPTNVRFSGRVSTDVIDFAAGFEYAITGSTRGFPSGIRADRPRLPFRADWIPSGGFEG
jgi:hypothetical protein